MLSRKEFDQVFDSLYIIQNRDEFWWLYEKVAALNPKIIIEIGVEQGGTLKFWQSLLPKDGMLIGIDADPLTLTKVLENWDNSSKKLEANLSQPKLLDLKILTGWSTDFATAIAVGKALNHKRADFLFIDASYTPDKRAHQASEAEKEFTIYKGFVRDGGLIGFDDIHDLKSFLTKLPHLEMPPAAQRIALYRK